MTTLEQQLILHEGCELHFYTDTEGYLTLGVGFNVSARGRAAFEHLIGRPLNAHGDITRDEALLVLRADIARLQIAVPKAFPPYVTLDPIRQRVVLDMAFNIGRRAMGFQKAIACVKVGDWSGTVTEMWHSHWAAQVGHDRVQRLTQMMLTGEDYA